MRPDIQQQIHHAAQAAYEAVWDAAPPSAALVHSGAVYAEMAGIEDRAAEQYRRTVRDQCAALGVHERDYYLADRDAAVVFEPDCLADAVTT